MSIVGIRKRSMFRRYMNEHGRPLLFRKDRRYSPTSLKGKGEETMVRESAMRAPRGVHKSGVQVPTEKRLPALWSESWTQGGNEMS